MDWYFEVLRKYAVFQGRARRKEYWWFTLFNIIISILLAVIDGATGNFDVETGYGLFGAIYTLAVLIPSIAVSVRRLHDTGRSGWWLLILLLPLIGVIVILVFMLLDSNAEDNEYGPPPKADPF